MRIYNIKWDVSDSDHTVEEEQYILSTLPNEVIITDPNDIKEIENMHDGDSYIADYLSDEYGYCVESFMVDDNDEDDEARCDREMNELLWNILKDHYGHKVEIAIYGDPDNPVNICLEDMDTNEVILDAEIYTICARED